MAYPYPPEWEKQSKIKMELANNICEDCGQEANLVHHIDKSKYNHELSNLKALCIPCHQKYHPKASGYKCVKQRRPSEVSTDFTETPNITLGSQLLIARRDMDVTQEEVFKAIGVNIATLSNIENNKSDPKVSTVLRLCEFYNYKLMMIK